MYLQVSDDLFKIKTFRFYDFRIAELTLIQEFLRKRGLYVDFCFGYDGPSWSLIMAVVMLELVKAGMFHQCRSFEFPGIELHPEQFKVGSVALRMK